MKPIVYLSITGNVLFILWLLFNGMDSGWHATPVQYASYSGLIALLLLNSGLLYALLRRQK